MGMVFRQGVSMSEGQCRDTVHRERCASGGGTEEGGSEGPWSRAGGCILEGLRLPLQEARF